MGTLCRRLWVVVLAVGFAGALWAQSVPPIEEFKVVPATRQSIEQLRMGGMVLYMRHGPTDRTQADLPELKFDDCSSQRQLTDDGRKVALKIGHVLKKAHVPISDVWASPMCRTRETANLAFGQTYRTDSRLAYSSFLPAADKAALVAFTRQLLSDPVATGTNRVVVGHSPNLADLTGYFLKPEGALAAFEPLGDGQFRYRFTITPDQWTELAR